MAVADAIDAVFGGTADPQHYALYAAPSEQSTQLPSYDDKTRHVFSLYQQVRDLRESLLVDADNQTTKAAALKLSKQIIQQASDEWLLLFEAIELIDSLNKSDDLLLLRESLATTLAIEGECANEEKRCVINYAISRLSVS
jgi:hypothetical protein